MPDDVQALLDLEKRRCAAIAAADGATLASMLADDYVHIHMNGFEDDRKGHVEKVVKNPRRTERGEIKVRIFGDVALLNGPATNHAKKPDGSDVVVHAAAQQVLVRRPQGWIYVLTHMTPAREPTPAELALVGKNYGTRS
jgi:ketosteroid isomerase-like protein